MESIGEVLSEARKNHNYTVEQVARDTHISKRFIQALEEEDFSAFPGEAYIVGFLRNYAEYLELSSDELVNLYQNMKIQEQPIPIKELLETKPKANTVRRILLTMIILAVVIGIVYIGYKYIYPRISEQQTPVGGANEDASAQETSSVGEFEEYLFQEEVMVKWFHRKARVIVPLADQEYSILFLLQNDGVQMQLPDVTVDLTIGEETFLDFDDDSLPDIKLVLNDFENSDVGRRFNLGLYRIIEVAINPVETGIHASIGEEIQNDMFQPPIRREFYQPRIVLEERDRSLFNVEIVFRRYCLFRYLLDGERWEERFFKRNDVISLEANQEIVIWVSNAGALRTRIAGTDIDLGRPGEVATRLVRWANGDTPNSHKLEVLPVY